MTAREFAIICCRVLAIVLLVYGCFDMINLPRTLYGMYQMISAFDAKATNTTLTDLYLYTGMGVLKDIQYCILAIIIWLLAPLLSWLICPTNSEVLLSMRISQAKIFSVFYLLSAKVCFVFGFLCYCFGVYHLYSGYISSHLNLLGNVKLTMLSRNHQYDGLWHDFSLSGYHFLPQSFLYQQPYQYPDLILYHDYFAYVTASLAVLVLSYILLKKAKKQSRIALDQAPLASESI